MKEKYRVWLIMGGLGLLIVGVNTLSVPSQQRPLAFAGFALLFGFIILSVRWYQSLEIKRKAQVNLPLAGLVIVGIVAMLIGIIGQASQSTLENSENGTGGNQGIIWIVLAGLMVFVLFRFVMSGLRSGFTVLQPESVIRLTTRGLQWLPNNPFLLTQRAYAQQQIRQYDAAFADLDHAIDHRPRDVNLRQQRMWLHFQRHNYEAMLADAQFIFDAYPNMTNATNYGLALHRLKRYEEALDAYKRAETAGSTDPALIVILHSHRARLYCELHEFEAADYELKQINPDKFIVAPQIDQVKCELELGYAYLALCQNDLTAAEQHWQAADQVATTSPHVSSNMPQITMGMAVVKYRTERQDEAQQDWQRLVDDHPDYADSTWALAELPLPDPLAEVVIQLAESA